MKLVVLKRYSADLRYAFLPTGGLVIDERTDDAVEVITAGVSRLVEDKFDRVVESFNAELEQWH